MHLFFIIFYSSEHLLYSFHFWRLDTGDSSEYENGTLLIDEKVVIYPPFL